MPENTENYDLITTAQEAVEPYPVIIDGDAKTGIYLGRTCEGGTFVVDLRERLGLLPTRPPRKAGTTTLTDVDSFIDALTKHALPETELHGNARRGTITAIINAHDGTSGDLEGDAGHGDHRLILDLPFTQDWTDWTSRDGKHSRQADFAEFIEDHTPNFVTPTSADMLELAQTFQATTKVDFASSQRIKSGETQLAYTENTNATAGRKGALSIPDTFELALRPFERGTAYKVGARFRYRITDSTLTLGYRLDRPHDVLQAAFDDVVDQIEVKTERTVWHTT